MNVVVNQASRLLRKHPTMVVLKLLISIFLVKSASLHNTKRNMSDYTYILGTQNGAYEINLSAKKDFGITNRTIMAVDYTMSGEQILIFYSDSENNIFMAERGSWKKENLAQTGSTYNGGIAFDWINEVLYFTDRKFKSIEVVDIHKKKRAVVIDNLAGPRSITVNPLTGYMYWVEYHEGFSKIYMAGMDGSNSREIIADANKVKWIHGITCDYVANRIYWSDGCKRGIYSAAADGSDQKIVVSVSSMTDMPPSASVLGNYIFFYNLNQSFLISCNKFTGKDCQQVVSNRTKLLNSFAIIHHLYHPQGQKACDKSVGECSHVCTSRPRKLMLDGEQKYACACPSGMTLDGNNTICVAEKINSQQAMIDEVKIGYGFSFENATLPVLNKLQNISNPAKSEAHRSIFGNETKNDTNDLGNKSRDLDLHGNEVRFIREPHDTNDLGNKSRDLDLHGNETSIIDWRSDNNSIIEQSRNNTNQSNSTLSINDTKVEERDFIGKEGIIANDKQSKAELIENLCPHKLSADDRHPYHKSILHILTNTGCIIMVLCLLLTLLLMTIKSARCSFRDTVHINLCVCLLVAEVLFMISTCIPHLLGDFGCKMLAGMLHYVLLCSFVWMFCDSVELWFMVGMMFDTVTRTRFYYPLAYCVPMVIVSIAAGVFPQGYSTSDMCWFSSEQNFVFVFVGPVCVVLVGSLGMFFITLMMMYCSCCGRQLHENHSQITCCMTTGVILLILLSVTWILGSLKSHYRCDTFVDLMFLYIFVVLHTLQGPVFFFLLHKRRSYSSFLVTSLSSSSRSKQSGTQDVEKLDNPSHITPASSIMTTQDNIHNCDSDDRDDELLCENGSPTRQAGNVVPRTSVTADDEKHPYLMSILTMPESSLDVAIW